MVIKLDTINDVKKFVKICEKFEDNIDVRQGRWIIDGKSIMGVFSLNLTQPLNVTIDTTNEDMRKHFYKQIKEWNDNTAEILSVTGRGRDNN